MNLRIYFSQSQISNIINYFSNLNGTTLALLSESEAPTNIIYIAQKPGYETTRMMLGIGKTHQTHILYLDPTLTSAVSKSPRNETKGMYRTLKLNETDVNNEQKGR